MHYLIHTIYVSKLSRQEERERTDNISKGLYTTVEPGTGCARYIKQWVSTHSPLLDITEAIRQHVRCAGVNGISGLDISKKDDIIKMLTAPGAKEFEQYIRELRKQGFFYMK